MAVYFDFAHQVHCFNCLKWASGREVVPHFFMFLLPWIKTWFHSLVPSRGCRSSGKRVFHRSTNFGWIISGSIFKSPIAPAPHNFPKLASIDITWKMEDKKLINCRGIYKAHLPFPLISVPDALDSYIRSPFNISSVYFLLILEQN